METARYPQEVVWLPAAMASAFLRNSWFSSRSLLLDQDIVSPTTYAHILKKNDKTKNDIFMMIIMMITIILTIQKTARTMMIMQHNMLLQHKLNAVTWYAIRLCSIV